MPKVIKLLTRIATGIKTFSLLGFALAIGYICVNLILFQDILIPFVKTAHNEIVKKAVVSKDLRGKNYIVCKWVATTDCNFELIKDENGNRKDEYVLVSGISVESFLTHNVLTSNYFVFYVVERIEHTSNPDDKYGEFYTEYIVDGWDILYPVRHDMVYNTAPRYVLKSDYFRSEDP